MPNKMQATMRLMSHSERTLKRRRKRLTSHVIIFHHISAPNSTQAKANM